MTWAKMTENFSTRSFELEKGKQKKSQKEGCCGVRILHSMGFGYGENY